MLCDKASASMYDAGRNANLLRFAEPKMRLAVTKLGELGIKLDSEFKTPGGVRFNSLQTVFYNIAHYLTGGDFELAKDAAEKHNAAASVATPER